MCLDEFYDSPGEYPRVQTEASETYIAPYGLEDKEGEEQCAQVALFPSWPGIVNLLVTEILDGPEPGDWNDRDPSTWSGSDFHSNR